MNLTHTIPMLHADAVQALLPRLDTQNILRQMFRDLAARNAVQPPQTLALFPGGGDFISYAGVLAAQNIFGVKLSPYVPRPQGPLVTAWSLLMSMATGQPLMLCDAGLLTVERTAAATAIATDALARADARILCVVGLGALGQAHVRHALALRDWSEIRLHAPNLAQLPASQHAALQALDPRIRLVDALPAATLDADVLMLCTSSASPVLQHGWTADAILGDLPELMAGTCPLPDGDQSIFFRSIGLGLEDIAVAAALYALTLK
jgi:L-arginine dehydrogenase